MQLTFYHPHCLCFQFLQPIKDENIGQSVVGQLTDAVFVQIIFSVSNTEQQEGLWDSHKLQVILSHYLMVFISINIQQAIDHVHCLLQVCACIVR